MSILEVKDLSHTYADHRIFNKASMDLYGGDKMGLTGLNGAGKSTFINILTEKIVPDGGYVKWNSKIRLGYLDQQATLAGGTDIRTYLRGAYAHLYETERLLEETNALLSQNPPPENIDELVRRAGEYQDTLERTGFYSVSSEVERVAAGLGVTAIGMERQIDKLSGGQRAKIMLAKLLLERPDVLLLDEPTNFLDREHIDWLAKYLISFKGSFIIVSHDYHFLNRVTNCICDIENGHIYRYGGSYESFVKQKQQRQEAYAKNYAAQQKEIAKLEEYIDKNLTRASTSAMAKSRRKKLEKMERLDRPTAVSKPTFTFPYSPMPAKMMLEVKELYIGYDQILLPAISLELKAGQKLAITGFNGIGKTTLLKTLCGLIPSLGGEFKFADHVVTGFFEQENRWDDPSRSPIMELREIIPRLTEKEARAVLARCGLKNDLCSQNISTLSGGEQAKVKIAKLILRPHNLLVLDEPTNHLDVNAIEQLSLALRAFEGTVIFVSHSREFVEETADFELNLETLFDD